MKNSQNNVAQPGKTWLGIVLVLLTTIFVSTGQLLWKLGTRQISLDLVSLITNLPLIGGFVLFGLGALTLILALKQGELSIIYPFVSLSFIWVTLLSIIFLGENIKLLQWLGLAIVVLGVIFVAKGANGKTAARGASE
jgi:drug/metabolite transporter (DMT)-like permease